MSEFPACPECQESMTYFDGQLLNCPMCGHAWAEGSELEVEEDVKVRDSNGNPLADGDTVTVIQDIRVSGKDRIKQGSKAKNIRILDEPVNDHDIECTIDGFGRMYLKSIFVKK